MPRWHWMPRSTCGPEPRTASAPASIIVRAKRRVSPRFSPKAVSRPCGTCVAPEPSAPAWMKTITTSAREAAAATSCLAALRREAGSHAGPPDLPTCIADVQQRPGPLVRRVAEERHAHPVRLHHAHGPAQAGARDARLAERRLGLAQAGGAEVARVVVRHVEHLEAGPREHPRVRGRRLEGVAVRAARRRTCSARRARACPQGCRSRDPRRATSARARTPSAGRAAARACARTTCPRPSSP